MTCSFLIFLSVAILSVGAILPARSDTDPIVQGSWPGSSRAEGVPLGVAVSGSRAYLAHGTGGLLVIDITNPAQPELLGGLATEGAFAQGVAMSGNLAFVASGDMGLQVIDVSVPAHPLQVGAYSASRPIIGVAVSGTHAYVTDESGLDVVDISHPGNPLCVGQFTYLNAGYARAVAVLGDHAYVVGPGLQVIDISDRARPHRVGEYADGDEVHHAVAVSGHFACLASGGTGVQVIDISDPANPRRTGGYRGNRGSGSARGIAISGSHGFVSEWPHWDDQSSAFLGGGLQVIDLSDPANPRRVGGYDGVQYAFGVALSGSHAFLVHGGQQGWPGEWLGAAGLQAIDVSIPAHPQRLGAWVTTGTARAVAVSGNHAYLADGGAGLQVIDISKPATPRRVSRYATRGDAGGVAVSGDYAYLADGQLQVIDISDPANPRRVGGCGAGAFGVAISGQYAYVADGGLNVVDISIPTDPRRVGGSASQGAAYGVAASHGYAYLADYNLGLLVFDVSNPADPRRVGAYPTVNTPALGVAVSGHHAYLATAGGMEVIDISNRTSPRGVGTYATSGYARGVTIIGDRAYVAGDWGMQVVDVSDPSHPVRVGGNVTINAPTYGVAVAGNLAFVAAGLAGMTVIDVSHQANPQPVGSYAMTGYDWSGLSGGLAVSGGHAYVPAMGLWDGTNYVGFGLQIIDISQPASPRGVGALPDPGITRGVAVSGNHAYVANGGVRDASRLVGSGLQVIDVSNPANPRRVGRYAMRGSARNVTLSGNHAYVTHDGVSDGTSPLDPGIDVIDISDPAVPEWTGGYATRGPLSGLAVRGNHACAAGFGTWDGVRFAGAGLEVIDISNPANPRHVGGYATVGQATALAVAGDHAYLAEFDLVDGGASPSCRVFGEFRG